jgi:hypothetical protein
MSLRACDKNITTRKVGRVPKWSKLERSTGMGQRELGSTKNESVSSRHGSAHRSVFLTDELTTP